MYCNPVDITSFLTFRYPITDHALFRDCWGVAITDWRPQFSCSDATFEEAVTCVQELLSISIHKMVQGKQVGIAVGGLDSSLIVALARELYPDRELYTYSVGFGETNEFEYARMVANQYGTQHTEVHLGKTDYMEGLRPLVRYKGAPLHPNELALACAESAAVRDGCEIVLCGEGADGIFGGYGQNLCMYMNYVPGDDYVAFLLQNYRYISLEDRAALIRDEYLMDDVELLRPLLDDAPIDIRDRMFYFIQRVHTVGLHARGANAMRFNGLPVGFPYIAPRLVSYVNSLPFDYKVHWKSPEDEVEAQGTYFRDVSEERDIPKYILKKLAEHYLPQELIYRKKCAFPVPFDDWFHKTQSWPLDQTVFKTTDMTGLTGWGKFMMINLNTFVEEFGGLMAYQDVRKDEIKEYWETRLPQVWYSNKPAGSSGWFNELEYKRYHTYYGYIPLVAEFGNHSGENVLEIGVGVGTDIVQYAKGGAIVSGIDLTESAVEMTRENLRIQGLGYASLRVGDAERLDFDDKSFDLVYCFGVLHHTPRPDHAIAEIHRVLKDGGKAIIMLYARGWKHYFKRVLIHGILLGKWFKYGYNKLVSLQSEVHGASPLTYVYTKKEIERLFSSFGEVSITRYRLGEYFDYAPYHTKKVPLVVKNVMDLLAMGRLVGENYIIKAVKTPERSRHSFWRTLLAP